MILLENPLPYTGKHGGGALRFDARWIDEDKKPLLLVRGFRCSNGKLCDPVVPSRGGYMASVVAYGRLRSELLEALRDSGWPSIFSEIDWPPEVTALANGKPALYERKAAGEGVAKLRAIDAVCVEHGCQFAELNASAKLRWKADQRAIERWQAATGRKSTWPDHADLCVWLMEQLEEVR